MAKFRKNDFDAVLVLAQIILVQSLFYLLLALIQGLFFLLLGNTITLITLTSWNAVDSSTGQGWAIILCLLFHSALMSLVMLFVVERARLCLDFSVTAYGFHVLISWWSAGSFPFSLIYWLVVAICTVILTRLSQEICMYQELKPINLSGGGRGDLGENLEMSSFIP
jgi:hypothetical protein